jgi:oxygen-dependent protoporphyrinogen oxidase
MPEDVARVVIIGAGVSGLATALAIEDLFTQGGGALDLQVLEAEQHVGGKIRTIEADGFTCEWGVNGFLNKEPKTLELCQRIELDRSLLPAATVFKNRYLYTRGKLRPVQMHPLKFMLSGLLPLRAKLRLLREPWIKPRPAGDGADESVADFARRRVGPVAYQVLVDSMQTGIFAGDPEQMSVASCFPRVLEVEREYGSLIKGMAKLARERRRQGEPLPGAGPAGHLTSFKGGMQTLVDQLAAKLGPERIRCGARVRTMTRSEGRYTIRLEGTDEPLDAEAVVLACPSYEAAAITRDLDGGLSATLREIAYSPLVVVCLGYDREQVHHPLQGFGFLAPRNAGLRVLGALWTSSLFPERVPQGKVLLRVMIGGARDPDVLELDDQQLTLLVRQEIERIHGIEGSPGFVRVFRHRRAIPQYQIGHRRRLDRIQTRLSHHPGLVITGNAYLGIGVNDCVRNAWPAAEQVASFR